MYDNGVTTTSATTHDEAGEFSRQSAVSSEAGRLRSIPTSDVRITGGLLGTWQDRNRDQTIPHSITELRNAGNLKNLEAVINGDIGEYQGRYPFLDTDIYKTLEGLVYVLASQNQAEAIAEVRAFYEEAIGVLTRVQAEDGYLNSFYQHPKAPKEPWADLAWGHELYNLGHLIQAAVAASRQLNDDRLLSLATRFANLAYAKFGPDGAPEVCGHPEVEMALVELFRHTGERNYLTLAKLFVDRRGHGSITLSVFPAEYFQDNFPLRDLPSVTGHAVRMGYLAAGAADVAIETGDADLLAQLERLWDDMVATKLYITGGLGSRHSDEAIGDRYELPSERSYSETCAAISVMQWGWRMFLATGEAKYADVYETVLYNGYAAGISADGMAFFYDNPLQRRPDHLQRSGAEAEGSLLRRSWFGCPCCPPNIIRWNAELQDYVAAADNNTVYLAQYADATIRHNGLGLTMSTSYPWDETVRIRISEASEDETGIALRVPSWARTASVTINGEPVEQADANGWLTLNRVWSVGDTVELILAMPVRAHGSHPYVDATRGAISFARGPLVYCAEQQDNQVAIDDLLVSPSALSEATLEHRVVTSDAPYNAVTITLPALQASDVGQTLYPELGNGVPPSTPPYRPASASLIPYYLWGNREAEAMRVWLRQH
ncbi:glycoside hydrolase family 127 protein [Lysinibacter cavernae]|uniref:Glycoside hydrolase family 127 protein n=1 Tax=Lysinibacter cavernae TaxID=1640652 RepID=A0A7X5QYG3_9MICO|nr:beta-L-arabinofuranosidase domain-containing protein [Lysinibacter cavernae]NIH52303.1 hypothetical protein [Lysinibacter cavernae]